MDIHEIESDLAGRFHYVHNLDDMITAIPEVEPRLLIDETVFFLGLLGGQADLGLSLISEEEQ